MVIYRGKCQINDSTLIAVMPNKYILTYVQKNNLVMALFSWKYSTAVILQIEININLLIYQKKKEKKSTTAGADWCVNHITLLLCVCSRFVFNRNVLNNYYIQ